MRGSEAAASVQRDGILLRRQHAYARREVQAEGLHSLAAIRRQQQFLARSQLSQPTVSSTQGLMLGRAGRLARRPTTTQDVDGLRVARFGTP